jgi:hypothetical protein
LYRVQDHSHMRKVSIILLCAWVLFAGLTPARADGATAHLYALDASAFPSMTTLLDVYDAGGNFVSGLTSAAITLLEDNQPHPLAKVEELQPGVQFALALDPGPAFALRDANSVSRLDKVLRALQDWAHALPADSRDDLSLIPTGGTPSPHRTTGAALLNALLAYQVDARRLSPTLNTLSQALDVASEPTPQPGMKRAVLYVTSLPGAVNISAVQNLSARAASLGIRVSVWIVVSTDFFKADSATALKDLALSTGGQYTLFSGTETLPSPETYLAPLRHTYRLNYQSGLTAGGSHTLAAQVSLNGKPLDSEQLTFEMDVQPPNPVPVSPPDQIVRQIPDPQVTDLAALLPDQQTISMLVEFPDGHPRPLVNTKLYVDDQVAAENIRAPFDQFTWDLGGYTSSGIHALRVEATDSLGLTKSSLSVPVTVTVIKPKLGLAAFLGRHNAWVVVGAVLLAGGVLGLTLTWGRLRRLSGAAGRRSRTDPLTQPVVGETARRGLHLPWASQGQVKASPAYLVRLKDDGQPITAPPIPLPSTETTFGRDPIHASYLLDDPSVSPLHARLKLEADGVFVLADENSAAGTWVNYEQLTEPRRLQHGDVIHFGRLSYRFMLRTPPDRPAPDLTPTKP